MAVDAVSRLQANATSTPNLVLEYDRLAEAQTTDPEIQEIIQSKNSVQFRSVNLLMTAKTIVV